MSSNLHQGKSGIEPIGDQVAVRRDKPDQVTAGGIALPQRSQEYQRTGIVIAVGPGALRLFPLNADPRQEDMLATRFPMQCNVGDRIILPRSGAAGSV